MLKDKFSLISKQDKSISNSNYLVFKKMAYFGSSDSPIFATQISQWSQSAVSQSVSSQLVSQQSVNGVYGCGLTD